jgi:hypothetical protein
MGEWYICDVLYSADEGNMTITTKNHNTQEIKVWRVDAGGEGKLYFKEIKDSSLTAGGPQS